MSSFVTRFAPSPSGALHLGHAYSAIMAHDAARRAGGTFLLRIEDIDQGRCRAEFEEQIFDDLHWLGLTWDAPPLRQSDRMTAYHQRLAPLIEQGLVYRCFRTRKEIDDSLRAPHGAPPTPFVGGPLHPQEEERRLESKEPYSWRLSLSALSEHPFAQELSWQEITPDGIVSHKADYKVFGDIILGRKDNATSYHIASIHDDAECGITHIIRGDDLREAAGLHRLLYALFDLPPPVYQHHRLILGDDGKRLAKRDKAATLASLREAGHTPEDIRLMLGLPLKP